MRKKLLLILLLVVCAPFTAVHAESEPGSIVPSVPTSPQAEAFKMYGNMSVNPGTGIPDISIPLFEIDHHGYRLPLTLRYVPSPFRPGYNYDVFGHGWALSVSSCISRSIEGMPDESSDFKLDTDRLNVYYRNSSGIDFNSLNLKHDLFTAVLPDGSSFEFVIQKDNQGEDSYIISGDRKVNIRYGIQSHQISKFYVVDEQGIEYEFTGADTSYNGPGGTITPYGTAYVSWQLTSIQLPYSVTPITFTYGKHISSDFGRQLVEPSVRFHHYYVADASPDEFDVVYSNQTQQYAYQMKLLTSINYGDTNIFIDYDDGENSETYNYANRIRILDGGSLIREIRLGQHQSPLQYASGASGLLCSTLDSITFVGNDGITSETYRCEYLSSTFHFGGTDHWGYLNTVGLTPGVAFLNLFMEFDVSRAGTGFVRDVSKDSDDVSPFDKVKLTNATFDFRAPSSAESHCLLKKLIYPTGGYTEFLFENHEFMSRTDASGDYIYDKTKRINTKGGGFRIKEISDYAVDGVRTGIRRYAYGLTYHEAYGYEGNGHYTHTGVGEPTVDPTIENYMKFESISPIPMYIPYMVLGLDPYGEHRSFYSPFNTYDPSAGYPYGHWEFSCTFNAFNFRRILDGRQSVFYPEVTVYYVKDASGNCSPEHCDGKTVYKYDIYEAGYQDTVFYESPRYFDQVLHYDSQPFRHNLLIEQSEYKSDGQNYQLLRRESQTWHPSGIAVIGYDYQNPYGGDKFIPQYCMMNEFYTPTWRQLGHSNLYQREVTTFGSNAETFNETEQYIYAFNNLQSSKTRDAGGIHRETKWLRPLQMTNSADSAIVKKMIARNILSPVLKEERTGFDGYQCEYDEFAVDGGDTLLLPARYYGSQSAAFLLQSEILSYTSNGNPLEVTTKDNLHTVYLWGYGDRYLIAEIKNATLEQVEQAVSSVFGCNITTLTAATTPDIEKLSALRSHTSLSDAHVSTFTYKPLVGVTSITDPSGKTVYYEYDPLGRLQEKYYYEGNVIQTSNKRILQEYEYHYRNH